MNLNFYLDLDGVVVDFISAAMKILGREDLINNWKSNCYSMEEATGLTTNEIWKRIDSNGYEFWRDLNPYPWFRELFDLLRKNGKLVYLTSPSMNSNSYKGKVLWIQKHHGYRYRNFVLTGKKYLLANRNAILIDDSEKNCIKFRGAGGNAILFPRPWNNLYKLKDDPMDYVKDEVEKLLLKVN